MSASVLTRPALILNKNWQPVSVASVARALVLVYQDRALVVDPEDYRTYAWSDWTALAPKDDHAVQAVTMSIRVPEVVALRRYSRTRYDAVAFSRRNVFKRDHYRCQFCGCQPGSEELTIDHVHPRSRGGESSWTNCVLACLPCNNRKGARTPEEANMRLKRKPQRPSWRSIYVSSSAPIDSWSKFVSESYWNVTLES